MIHKVNRASIVVGIIFLILCNATMLRAQKQIVFGAEEEIKHPVKIPAAIMSELKRDARVKQCVDEKGTAKNNWFSAAIIDLNGDQTDDYVIKAENACLFGANLAPFWIFHNLTTRYSLVLRADTLGLEILPEKTDDYHNIKLTRTTATKVIENTLKFDGAHYR